MSYIDNDFQKYYLLNREHDTVSHWATPMSNYPMFTTPNT